MDIYYATTKAAKVISLKRDLNIPTVNIIQAAIEMPEPRSSDVEKIARAKIEFAYKRLKKPVIALDAGFYIHSLNGFPRAFVNFALETLGLDGLLKLAEGKDGACEFRECLAYQDAPGEEPQIFTARIPGRLSRKISGTLQKHHWSPLALIFIPEKMTKTLGEMTETEYLDWRHDYKKESSSKMFAKWFAKNKMTG